MDKKLIERILLAYGMPYKNIHEAEKGYRNSSYPITLQNGQMANLILYKSEAGMESRVKRANGVSNYLATHGLPARYTLDERIVRLRAKEQIVYGSLYCYLPGHTISWESYTKDHLKLTGMMMGAMHSALANVVPVENKVEDEYVEIIRWMRRYFAQVTVKKAVLQKIKLKIEPEIFDKFELLLALTLSSVSRQTLHMDFVRGNVLFEKSCTSSEYAVGKVAMSGIIDFEKTANGHPVFDIARTLAFLLVDCHHKPEQKIRKYFLVSGYNKRSPAEFKNIQGTYQNQKINLLEGLVDLFLVYDFYKFLRHNPYEFLEQNYHFVRTRDILIRRNMVEYSN